MPYGYYSRWGSKARLARRVTRSFKKGNKTTLVTIPTHVDTNFTFSNNDKYSDVLLVKPFNFGTESTSWFATLTNFKVYQHYSELFDEARIVGYRCKITINNAGTLTGGFLSVVSAVDRNFGPEDLAETPITHDEMMTNPAVVKQTMTNQSKGIFYRSIYPTSLLEKASYFDSTIHQTSNNVKYIPGYDKMATGFRPGIMFMLHKDAGVSGTTTIAARMEIETVVQFRNPKYQEIDSGDRSVRMTDKIVVSGADTFSGMAESEIEEKKSEEPVLKKKKVVYEEEVLPDDEDEEMDEDEQEPLTQPLKPAMKKAGKKSS